MNKLFEAKKKIPVIKKDAKNPFFKSGYATLSNIIEVVDPILAEQGLFIVHAMKGNTLITEIVDNETNDVYSSEFDLPVNTDIQKIGSAITYAKRYNITALLNLNIEDDDDGNATKPEPKKTKETTPYENAVISINNAKTLEMLTEIGEKIQKSSVLNATEKSKLKEPFKLKSQSLLNASIKEIESKTNGNS